MKKISLLFMLTVCLVMLVACTTVFVETNTGVVETGAVTEATGTEEGTSLDGTGEATTKAETEPAETYARYDYFGNDVLPNVAIEKTDYEAVTLKLNPGLLVTDEEVQNYITKLRFQERTATNGETQVTDQPLKWGDTAYIYYKGTIDGVAFDGGSNMTDEKPYALGLGSGSFIPGFEAGLVGVVPNTTSKDNLFSVHVTFPEDYGKEELNGKEAVFAVHVVYAVQYTMPDYTRSFVENTLKYTPSKEHITEATFLAEFEAYVKKYLEDKNASHIETAQTDALWTYLTGLIVCQNLPEEEIYYYTDTYKKEIQSTYDYYKTYGGADFLKQYDTIDKFAVMYMGLDEDSDWEAEIADMAQRLVKKDMIMFAVAELESMKSVSQEEIDEEIEYWIDYYGGYMTKDDILENMGEDYLKESAFAVKMFDFLLSKVTFVFEK